MKILLIITAMLAAVPAAAQTAAPSTAAPAANSMSDETYLLGPGDTIEVRVLGQTEFTTRSRIRENGTIALPFLGDVKATGENSTDFARTVGGKLQAGGYYAKPIVNVEIVSFASRYVTVLGAVGNSGLQPVDREYHLSEILARAGGLKPDSNDEIVIRNDAGQEKRLTYSQIALGYADSDPIVHPGDRIFAPAAESFYIYGQVNAPGAYPTKRDLTIRNALGRAGGLTANGSQNKVKIFRKGELVKLSMEDTVQPGDTIVVGERLF